MQTIKFGVGVIKYKKDLLSRIERSKVLELERHLLGRKVLTLIQKYVIINFNNRKEKNYECIKRKSLLGEHNKP